VGKVPFQLTDEFGGGGHVWHSLNLGPAPAGGAGLGLAAKIALAFAAVDTGAVIILLARRVEDALAGADADVALDVAVATRRLGGLAVRTLRSGTRLSTRALSPDGRSGTNRL
jgi:hypothetical protein